MLFLSCVALSQCCVMLSRCCVRDNESMYPHGHKAVRETHWDVNHRHISNIGDIGDAKQGRQLRFIGARLYLWCDIVSCCQCYTNATNVLTGIVTTVLCDAVRRHRCAILCYVML
jgi:hypothetical protein